VLLVAGLGVLFYPQARENIYERQVAAIQRDFYQNLLRLQGEIDPLHEYLKEKNEKLFANGQEGLVNALSYEQPAVDLSAYGLRDNCIGFVSLPSIDMLLPIYLGANEENMRKGAVHMTQTSYPIGGENTNSVIAAHRGSAVLKFRYIDRIAVGDEIIITNFREELVYRAVEVKIIAPTDVSAILIQQGRDLITLVSCHPLGFQHQRYIVIAERVNIA